MKNGVVRAKIILKGIEQDREDGLKYYFVCTVSYFHGWGHLKVSKVYVDRDVFIKYDYGDRPMFKAVGRKCFCGYALDYIELGEYVESIGD